MSKFEKGDVVSLRVEALEKPLTPAKLIAAGFPNRFKVAKTERVVDLDTKEEISAVILAECCNQLTDVETGQHLCNSHPENLFTLIERAQAVNVDGLKPERETIVSVPFLGPVAQLGHYKKEDGSSALVLNILGEKIAVTGPISDLLAELAKSQRIL